mgnify:FL=1
MDIWNILRYSIHFCLALEKMFGFRENVSVAILDHRSTLLIFNPLHLMFITIFFLEQSHVFVIFNPFLDDINRRFYSSVNNLFSTTTICVLNHQSINSVIIIVVLIIGRLFEPLLNDMARHRVSQVHRPQKAPSVSPRERIDLALSGMRSLSIVYI